jgi:hypothetical protein
MDTRETLDYWRTEMEGILVARKVDGKHAIDRCDSQGEGIEEVKRCDTPEEARIFLREQREIEAQQLLREYTGREMWKVPVIVYVEATSKAEAQRIASETVKQPVAGGPCAPVVALDAMLEPKLAGIHCTFAGPLSGSILTPEVGADAGYMRGILADVANACEEPGRELSDMLADICHLAHAKGLDPQEVMDGALAVFQEEIKDIAVPATQKI